MSSQVCWLLLDCHAVPQDFVQQLWLRMDDYALLISPSILLSCFMCLSLFSIALTLIPLFFCANPTRGRMRRKDGRNYWRRQRGKDGKKKKLEWWSNRWVAGEMGEERGRDNWRNGSISSLYKCLNFKGGTADVGMWKCCTTPPPHPCSFS